MTHGSKDIPETDERLVYIRALGLAEARRLLPPDALADVGDLESLYVVTSAEGQNLAIVQGRDAAYAAALTHDFRPVSVH